MLFDKFTTVIGIYLTTGNKQKRTGNDPYSHTFRLDFLFLFSVRLQWRVGRRSN